MVVLRALERKTRRCALVRGVNGVFNIGSGPACFVAVAIQVKFHLSFESVLPAHVSSKFDCTVGAFVRSSSSSSSHDESFSKE